MKVRHEMNRTRSHLTMFFIMYKSQILVKVKSVNSEKVELLHLVRNKGSSIFRGKCLTAPTGRQLS